MEKKESSTGIYGTTFSSGVFVGKLSTPTTKTYLTDQTKVALLEYLTESDEFHKLVCDITGTERKQVKVSPELEKLKEDYSHVCNGYKQEQQKSNDLLHKYMEETAKRLGAEKDRDCAQKHNKFVIDEISSMLKEVKCISVRGIVDELKAERLRVKVLSEDNESIRRECERLKLSYDKVCEEKKNLLSNYNYLLGQNKTKAAEYEKLQALYSDALLTNTKLSMEKEKAEKARYETEKMCNTDFEYLNKCNQNQAKTITNQMNDLLELRTELAEQKELVKKHMAKSEKLQSKLDKASKRYGELIKQLGKWVEG